MRTDRIALILLVATGGFVLGLAHPALADLGDISVGGVWAFRLMRGTSGMALDQRVAEVERRITNVLSIPRYRTGGVSLTVRPVGAGAAIMVGDAEILVVTPEDVAATGVKVTVLELARQWAQRLANGLNRALPDARFAVF